MALLMAGAGAGAGAGGAEHDVEEGIVGVDDVTCPREEARAVVAAPSVRTNIDVDDGLATMDGAVASPTASATHEELTQPEKPTKPTMISMSTATAETKVEL